MSLTVITNNGIVACGASNSLERIPHPKVGGIFMPAVWREPDNKIPERGIFRHFSRCLNSRRHTGHQSPNRWCLSAPTREAFYDQRHFPTRISIQSSHQTGNLCRYASISEREARHARNGKRDIKRISAKRFAQKTIKKTQIILNKMKPNGTSNGSSVCAVLSSSDSALVSPHQQTMGDERVMENRYSLEVLLRMAFACQRHVDTDHNTTMKNWVTDQLLIFASELDRFTSIDIERAFLKFIKKYPIIPRPKDIRIILEFNENTYELAERVLLSQCNSQTPN